MKKFFVIFIMILVSVRMFSQTNEQQTQIALDTGTIENRFDYIINKSSSFKEFQLIRKTSILRVKKHVLDSLSIVQKELKLSEGEKEELQSKIEELKAEITTLTTEKEEISKNVESINLLGMPINKTSYSTIVWGIIFILLATLSFFVYQFSNHHKVTASLKNELAKEQSDFEAFRKRALVKEQEVMRKLQDEINKNNP